MKLSEIKIILEGAPNKRFKKKTLKNEILRKESMSSFFQQIKKDEK